MNWEALWKYMWCCWTFLGSLMVAFTEAISGYKRLTLKSILRYVKIRSKYHILHCGTKPAVYCVDHVAQCQKPSTPSEAILLFCTPSKSSPSPVGDTSSTTSCLHLQVPVIITNPDPRSQESLSPPHFPSSHSRALTVAARSSDNTIHVILPCKILLLYSFCTWNKIQTCFTVLTIGLPLPIHFSACYSSLVHSLQTHLLFPDSALLFLLLCNSCSSS